MAALGQAPDRIRPWLVLAGWCGLRTCEIAGLRRENILDTAQPPVLIVSAESAKGRTERVVPMTAFVVRELRAAGLPARGYVFRRADGGPGANAPWLVSHLIADYLHSIGVAATAHQWRHRCFTMLYRETLNLRMVQDAAGHASPESTAGYTALCPADAVAGFEALPVPPRLRRAS